ncbi:MAG TPA: hypothetical protein VL154_00995 [Acetobacteraceae bacterium]|jgi:hypothetical protein|nr:hypothetical protein [Acetobacteraceae bacterium]
MRLSLSPRPAVQARIAHRARPTGSGVAGASILALLLALSACSKAPPPPPPPPPAPVVSMDPVPPAKICAKPDEKQAFDVTGLKTRLMVAAIVCGSSDQYNAFIRRNRADLVQQDRDLQRYFNRAYGGGRAAQSHMDAYKTDLANVQQQRRSRDPQFCQGSTALFGALAAAKTPGAVGPVASSAGIDQPMVVSTCN